MLHWIWEYRYLFEMMILFSFPLDINPEVRLLSQIVVLPLISWGDSILFPIIVIPVYKFAFPPTVHKDFLSSTSLPVTVGSCLFDNRHPNRCEVIPHCGVHRILYNLSGKAVRDLQIRKLHHKELKLLPQSQLDRISVHTQAKTRASHQCAPVTFMPCFPG